MQDRVPLYPGRVTLTPVSGQANTFDLVRADQPRQEGTPLNKASLLKDTTAALFGLGTSAVPDDVLSLLPSMINNRAKIEIGSYTGTGTFGKSHPNRLTFSFEPKTLYIKGTNDVNSKPKGGFIWVNPSIDGIGNYDGGSTVESWFHCIITWGKTVTWYSNINALAQVNYKNTSYTYFALG